MSDQKDGRPAKQRRIHGLPLLNQTSSAEDDEDSSSSSSSSSVQLPTTRLSHRLLKGTSSLPPERSSSDGESGDENDGETTSSSESEDSDSDETSEGDEDEDEDEEDEDVEEPLAASDSGIPRFTTNAARASDLKSRLQRFLPQLQQANVELQNSRGVVDKRIDHVSDDAEHYIEMEVGLGVLSEQNDDATQIRLRHASPSEEEDNADNDETKRGQEDTVLSRLDGTSGTKGTKRKIEEL